MDSDRCTCDSPREQWIHETAAGWDKGSRKWDNEVLKTDPKLLKWGNVNYSNWLIEINWQPILSLSLTFPLEMSEMFIWIKACSPTVTMFFPWWLFCGVVPQLDRLLPWREVRAGVLVNKIKGPCSPRSPDLTMAESAVRLNTSATCGLFFFYVLGCNFYTCSYGDSISIFPYN